MTSWGLAAIAGVLLTYAGLSRALERTPVTGAIFFLSAGLIVGNEGLGWIDFGPKSEQVRLLAELTLTLVLFADASRIDVSALRREYTVPARLLGIGLPLTILAGWALGAGMFGSVSAAEVLDPRGDPGSDRRRFGAGRRDRSTPSLPHPAGTERGVGAQRRHLRPASVHRARDSRGRSRDRERARRPRARGRCDRLRRALRRDRRSSRRAGDETRVAARPDGLSLGPGPAARHRDACLRARRAARWERIHRGVRRRLRVRCLAPRHRGGDHVSRRRGGAGWRTV